MSFWLPGLFGSLAAVPVPPGLSLPVYYYHASMDAGGSFTFKRGGVLAAGIDADADLVFVSPTYALPVSVLGGQLAFSLGAAAGYANVNASVTFTGPNRTVSAGRSDDVSGFADLYPSALLQWNAGSHNFMLYGMGGIPVGAYELGRIANLGLNHWSLDGGAGYTFLSKSIGLEFSAVSGFTVNFENPDTNYKNGIDFHVDGGLSQFLSKHIHVGAVGYYFQQITGDSGSGAVLGDFKSRVMGVGPQVGCLFEAARRDVYVNLRGYWEFAAENRPEGWNLWVTLAVPITHTK